MWNLPKIQRNQIKAHEIELKERLKTWGACSTPTKTDERFPIHNPRFAIPHFIALLIAAAASAALVYCINEIVINILMLLLRVSLYVLRTRM